MTPPSTSEINHALKQIESSELSEDHPRKLAAQAIKRYRRGTAIDHSYDFAAQRVELRQVIYDQAVRYHCHHSWLSRLLRRT